MIFPHLYCAECSYSSPAGRAAINSHLIPGVISPSECVCVRARGNGREPCTIRANAGVRDCEDGKREEKYH